MTISTAIGFFCKTGSNVRFPKEDFTDGLRMVSLTTAGRNITVINPFKILELSDLVGGFSGYEIWL